MAFIRTSAFRAHEAQYSRSVTVPLVRPSSDTAVLVTAALVGLRLIYRPGFLYSKVGVMLVELQPQGLRQGELDFGSAGALMGGLTEQGEKANGAASPALHERTRLMAALDDLNSRYGRGTLRFAVAGLAIDQQVWAMKQARRSPGYTTRWADMPTVRM